MHEKRLPQLSETIHFSYTPQLLMRIHCKEYPRYACAGFCMTAIYITQLIHIVQENSKFLEGKV